MEGRKKELERRMEGGLGCFLPPSRNALGQGCYFHTYDTTYLGT